MAEQVRDIRRKAIAVTVQDTVTDAARARRDGDVGSVMVRGDRQPVDVLTDRDIVVRAVAVGGAPQDIFAGNLGSTEGNGDFAARRAAGGDRGGRVARRQTSAREPIPAMEKAGQR